MIPKCWANETENYITNPILMDFCMTNGILPRRSTRKDLLDSINEYSQKSIENNEKVEEWLEIILKQGIKSILFKKIEFDVRPTEEDLRKTFPECKGKRLCSNITDGYELNIQNIKYSNEKIEIIFTINLYEIKKYADKEIKNKIIYPIFIDIDLEQKLIFGRAKSKSNIYRIEKHEEEIYYSTSTENLIIEAIDFIENKLKFKKIDNEEYINKLKKSIYNILEKYTFTPQSIEKQIIEMDEYIDSFINKTLDMLKINDNVNFQKAKEDMKIFIEKYISINTKNKSIFMNDREAYPYKLIATDSEMTKVEETTTSYEPLQCKEKFFDNKKSIKCEESCDGIFLIYRRKKRENFTSNTFRTKISVRRKFCNVKFESYVIEEDIDSVLSDIINS